MAELNDAATIINRALARIGAGAITATDDDTDLARQCMAIFDDLADLAISLYPWTFARRMFSLQELAVDALGWDKVFNFPAEALGDPLKLLADPKNPDNPLRRFYIQDRQIHADEAALHGVFRVRPDSTLWPVEFRVAFTMWLAAELCVPVCHDNNLAKELRSGAIGSGVEEYRGGLIGRAITANTSAGGGVAPLLNSDPLTSARYSGPAGAAWHGDY